MSKRCAGGGLVVAIALSGCASMPPRIATSSSCQPGAGSFLVVHAVDVKGKHVPFAPVAITPSNRSKRVATKTSSLGTLRLALQPGSYSVAVGDNAAEWQSARASVRVRAGCVVTARAQLHPHAIDPNTTRPRDRVQPSVPRTR